LNTQQFIDVGTVAMLRESNLDGDVLIK